MFEQISHALSQIPCLGLIVLIMLVFCSYQRLSVFFHLFFVSLYFLKFDLGFIFWTFYIAAASLVTIPLFRRSVITKEIINLIKKLGLLPKISETEKIALTSGTVWVDGELFSGKPNFPWIYSQKYPRLTPEEQAFLDNEVEELCRICSDYETERNRDLTEEVWAFLRSKKFFGMVIPKEYGGLGFSAYAHSCVIQKLASKPQLAYLHHQLAQ